MERTVAWAEGRNKTRSIVGELDVMMYGDLYGTILKSTLYGKEKTKNKSKAKTKN